MSSGALTQDDLLALWGSVVDSSYSQPLIDRGEGYGLEAHTQAQFQLARVSAAIDATMQAMFIRPWSGQTGASAQGENLSTVQIDLSRAGQLALPLFLQKGLFTLEETTTDAGPDGSLGVLTGRRYILDEDVSFAASATGPISARFVAERPGWGYNDPLPNTIATPYQPGTNFGNDKASTFILTSPTRTAYLAVENQPDVVIPEHVGRYVLYTGGANAGLIRRIVKYDPPMPYALDATGGTVQLEELDTALVAENRAGSWRILDWSKDWQISAAHAAQPTGGRLGMLDALGEERGIRRAPGEDDTSYEERVASVADVVTPNSIIRAANRVMSMYGQTCSLLEPGTTYSGFFYDGDPSNSSPTVAFAWDLTGADHANKTWLSFEEFRGFFYIALKRLPIGEFGMAYEEDAYDLSRGRGAYDGYPIGDTYLKRQIWQAVDGVRAGGVGFTFIPTN